MAFLIKKVDGDITAHLIQQLAIAQVFGELHHLPATAENEIDSCVLCLLDSSRNDLLDELVHISLPAHDCSYALDGIAKRIVRVTIAATGHDESLAGVVYHLGLALLNIGFGSSLVAYIDILAVLHSEGFNNLISLRSENLAIDHKVGTIVVFAAG